MTGIKNKLAALEKIVTRQHERLTLALVGRTEAGAYTVDCRLWNGQKGSGERRVLSEHISEARALAAVEAISAKYPNNIEGYRVLMGIHDLAEYGGVANG